MVRCEMSTNLAYELFLVGVLAQVVAEHVGRAEALRALAPRPAAPVLHRQRRVILFHMLKY